MKNFIVFLFITGIAVLSISAKVFDKRHVSKDMLRFIDSGNYAYSKWKKDIPEDVIKGIKEFEKGHFNLGDIGDSGKIGMGCKRSRTDKFEGILNFVLISDSLCILSYSHGSIGISNTVYFIEYKPVFTLAKFYNLGYWSDTGRMSIINPLEKLPQPDTIWTKPN